MGSKYTNSGMKQSLSLREDKEKNEEIRLQVQAIYRLEIGNRFRISPNYGYAGTIPGVIEIVGMWTTSNLPTQVRQDSEVEQFIEDGFCDEDTIWIQYGYVQPSNDEEEYLHTFPVDLFADHISKL